MADPVGTVSRGAGGSGWRVKLEGPRRWVLADVMHAGCLNEYVIAWDCHPRPARHQACGVTRERWSETADGRPLRIVLAVELYPLHDRTLPVGTGPTARLDDPATAKAAGAGANKLKGQQVALLAHARHPDGLTDFELADLTHIPQTSIGCRRKDLMRAGLIERTTATRPSPSGSPAGVYRITDAGKIVARRLVPAEAVAS